MLEIIHGVVLRKVKFSDTKMIVDLFTLGHGRQSFVATISHSGHSKSQMAVWSPLSMVELNADIRPNGQLPKPKNIRLYNIYSDIPYNPLKSTIALFLSEFLSASLKDESVNVPLYRFLETSLQWFDQMDESSSIANFHLIFMLRLSRFIGIMPNSDESDFKYFDLMSATFTSSRPSHTYFLSQEESRVLPLLLRLDYSTMYLLRLTRTERARCLDAILTYYRLHIPSFPELKSTKVLHEVFA